MIKSKLICVFLAAILVMQASAQKNNTVVNTVEEQVQLPVFPDSVFTTYYHQRVTHFRTLPPNKR